MLGVRKRGEAGGSRWALALALALVAAWGVAPAGSFMHITASPHRLHADSCCAGSPPPLMCGPTRNHALLRGGHARPRAAPSLLALAASYGTPARRGGSAADWQVHRRGEGLHDGEELSGLRTRADFGHFFRWYTDESIRGNAGPEHAVAVLKQMRASGVAPDLATYSKLLDVCAHAAQNRRASIEDVGNLFSQMAHDNLRPNTRTMNAMLKVCSRLAAQGQACILDGFEMFQWCLDSGLALSQPYLVVGKAHASRGASTEPEGLGAPFLVEPSSASEMSEDEDEGEGRGKGSRVSWRALMDGGDASKWATSGGRGVGGTNEEVEAIIEVLQRVHGRITPDVITYNTLVEICAKSALHGGARLQDAFKVVKLMDAQNIRPDVVTFGSLMSMCASLAKDGNATLSDGYAILRMMDNAAIRPDTRIFNSLLSVCAKCAGRGTATVRDGEEVLKEMQRRGLREDRYTYNSMIDVCVRDHTLEGKLETARGVVRRMEQDRVRKDAATFNMLIQCARADGNVREARKLFEGMGRDRNARTYTIVLAMCSTLGDAIALLRRAKQEGIRPNVHMYNPALEVAQVSGWEGGYAGLREEMKKLGVRANAMTRRIDLRAERMAGNGVTGF